MRLIRKPAVAGQFYPGESGQLRRQVGGYLAAAGDVAGPGPKAIIAPHAGYIYSGPIAGTAYAYLAQTNRAVRRVILLGPAHWVHVRGLAASSAESFATPMGSVPLDQTAQERILALQQVQVIDEAHEREHSLEVQLPFLQSIFADFSLVPLAVGSASATDVAEVLSALWGERETVIVISSDLSHYNDYQTALELDKVTARAIEGLEAVGEGQACGRRAINGLLQLARERGLSAHTVDLRNSGDTAGSRDRVVGYGAFTFVHESDMAA
jgi:AmmeMemoRadiSam system protein B